LKNGRDGFVLVAALFAIVLIGALVTGVLFASTEDTKMGATGVSREVALMAAESAIAITISNHADAFPNATGVAATMSIRIDRPGPPAVVYITRLDSALYSIVADVVPERERAGARRRIEVVVRTITLEDRSIAIDPVSERHWSELF
jgi:Tfp pilus assembly protein PilX